MVYLLVEFLDDDATHLYAELNDRREFVCMRDSNGDVVPENAWPWYSYRCIAEVERGPWEP